MKKIIVYILVFIMLIPCASGETLRPGMSGETIVQLQQALIEQGYLTGNADGIYGRKTEKAVRNFQKKKGLKVDGLAGKKTQELLFDSSSSLPHSGIFSGDYSKITAESNKKRIMLLQNALGKMNYLNGTIDGIYGTVTANAVKAFQREQGLKVDGIAGQKTLLCIEEKTLSGYKRQTELDRAAPISSSDGKIDAPAKESVQLLHWYNDIKPNLKAKANLLIYEPISGLSWTLVVHSKGRHCDAEPKTLKDTQIMLKAFNNKNTWAQKGVYVLLPDGRWTIGATHTVPYLNQYIKDNGFDGHLSVHFFRDMDECTKMDPNYGVSNQRTIRELWKKTSGEIL